MHQETREHVQQFALDPLHARCYCMRQLQLPYLFFFNERLDDVAHFDVVKVFDADTALKSGGHFFGVVFEAFETSHFTFESKIILPSRINRA